MLMRLGNKPHVHTHATQGKLTLAEKQLDYDELLPRLECTK